MGYIYMIRNKVNNTKYIGQTTQHDINSRWNQHKRNINTNSSSYLYSAFRKYGLESFDFRIICICFDEACDELEKQYILKYHTLAPNGYNIENGGKRYKIVHESTKEKIINALKGKKHSDFRKLQNRISHIGYKHTDISKQKMSISRKGRKMTEEAKKNMSLAQMNHKVSENTKIKVASANKKRIWTTEMKNKMSKSLQTERVNYKPVGMFDSNNILVEKYISIKEASEKTSIYRCSISKVCNGERKKAGGYYWKFL